MAATEAPAGHLLLVGDPGAALDVAAGMVRDAEGELSVRNASMAALERLQRSGRPLVMVDVAIDVEDVVARLNGNREAAPAALPAEAPVEYERLVGRTVAEVERELILQTLARCHGNRTSAANILGISVRTMRNKLRSFIEDGIAIAPAS
ncbi:helix-turn-helix domain-containing protein [Sphingomonas oligoaromativorans]|jgi:DNA-binding NtrC family response regulator|uniref:helix-turn-helix domain-containing protein n=1 Tax=Sphingomonas oligoaromativorans TaxID=575322 RepID=UPI00141DBD42|nr:helix-turn-helix domain-containing protein [Sphingomonas oligoaromativorans]NIJ34715.1 DNA-binding NtrC family response regulator [Sphingomonas oligoaromativorans]